jgi:hypothetical protein
MGATQPGFVLRTLPSVTDDRLSRAAREREARAYWKALTPEQEVWALRKMGFFDMGKRREPA